MLATVSYLKRLAIVAAAAAVFAAGYLVFHPGITFAETPLARDHAAAAFPQDGNFTVDPAHTSVGFDIGHLGISRVQGRFDKLTGSLHADAKDAAKSNVNITIDASSIDTAVAPRDADLRSPNFFDTAKFPEITFASTSIKKHGKGYTADGNLTMKGVTKPVTIKFMLYGPIKDPRGNTRIGVVADPFVIHRADFGMTFDADTVSNDVTVRLSLEAVLNKADK